MKHWAILLPFFATGAQAGCLGQEPLAAARALYEKHSDFYIAESKALEGLLGERLGALLAQEYACLSGGEICALEADPWLGAQDGDAVDVRYTLENGNDVAMKYKFTIAGKSKPQTVHLKMSKGADGCWRVEDMVDPHGESLVKLLQLNYEVTAEPASKKSY